MTSVNNGDYTPVYQIKPELVAVLSMRRWMILFTTIYIVNTLYTIFKDVFLMYELYIHFPSIKDNIFNEVNHVTENFNSTIYGFQTSFNFQANRYYEIAYNISKVWTDAGNGQLCAVNHNNFPS